MAAGTNWPTAVRSISNGISKAVLSGDVVWVSNGTYWITTQLRVTNGITLRSVNGLALTAIRRQGPADHRIIDCTHTGAVIRGFTLRDGNVVNLHGGAVSMVGGTIRDSAIVNSSAASLGGYGGGGIYATGASIISNCFFTGCVGGHFGGALYIAAAGPVVSRCVFSNNTGWIWGGAVNMAGGILTDSTVMRNQLTGNDGSYGGGGIRITAGSVINCTVAGNTTPERTVGAGIRKDGGTVTNTIVYRNTRGTFEDGITTAAGVTRSCAPELTSGVGNITADPDFVDAVGCNYRILLTSPCLDTGTNASIRTVDVEGKTRPTDGKGTGTARADMGAYEEPARNSDTYRCSFTGTPLSGLGSVNVIFTALVAGANTNGTVYAWDFENDGITNRMGSAFRVVTNTFSTPGLYTISLVVTNTAGQRAGLARSQYICLAPAVMYVATNGHNISPYSSWYNASTNLDATLTLQTDGGTIMVSNGTFLARNAILNRGVTVRGLNGAAKTVFKSPGGNTRVFELMHSNAVLDGLTITGGDIVNAHGGGIHLLRGTVQNCVVISNRAASNVCGGGNIWADGPSRIINCTIRGGYAFHYSGGIFLAHPQAVVDSCIMSNNSAYVWGGGIFVSDGTVRNSLVCGNWLTGNHPSYGGGGARILAGRIENCAVAGNRVGDLTPGGGIRVDGGTITNSIIYYNLKGTLAQNLSSTAGVRWSCSPDLTAGTGNTALEPEFADRARNDYRLWPASPCIDSGTNLVGITNDIAGSSRPIDGNADAALRHDMGAYEAMRVSDAPFRCNFQPSVRQGPSPLDVVFTACQAGPDTNNLYYRWDFNNDGSVDSPGFALGVVTQAYAMPGIYGVRLTISNAVSGAASHTKTNLILVYANTLYVSTNGSHVAPFTNWANASTNLASVLSYTADGVTVRVTNGVYYTPPLQLSDAITLRSENGPAATRVERIGPNGQIFDVIDPGVVIDGFTLTGGKAVVTSGGAVRLLYGGTLRNCIVTNNTATDNVCGGGVFIGGPGTIENCLITGNSGFHYSGGVYMDSPYALLNNCIITNNTASIFGAGVYAPAGTIRNCLIAGNRILLSHPSYGGGAMVLGAGARAENCTIVNNRAATDSAPGGVWLSGTMTNCIIYYNYRNGVQDNFKATSLAAVNYSCSPVLTSGVKNISSPPLFTATNRQDYTLMEGSPCINAGTNRVWMDITTLDLAGRKRIVHRIADLGAYEFHPKPGMTIIVN